MSGMENPTALPPQANPLERHLLVWLCVVSLLALLWPRLGSAAVAHDPFLWTKDLLARLIAVTMFVIGWLLPNEEIRQVARRWPLVVGGTCVQYVAMPLLAWTWGNSLRLDGPYLWGVMMAGCVPGAMASNVLTLMSRGNTSYSVCLTTLATLLSPLVVPTALKFSLGAAVEFPAAKTSWTLLWMVVIPVVAGNALTRLVPASQQLARRIGPSIANLTILWIIAVVVARNRGNLLGGLPVDSEVLYAGAYWRLVIALMGLNLSGYAAGFLGGAALRLDTSMRRALTLEVGMQNAGLGSALAITLFKDPAVALPAALYTFGCMLTGTVLARYWSRTASDPLAPQPTG